MRRAFVLVLVILAALFAVGPAAAAAGPQRGLFLEFHSGGFYVQVKSPLGSGRVRLYLYRHGEVAYYYVPARVGAGTVQARFGRLGSLDLKFTPESAEGALGCGEGEGEGWKQGTFRGAFVFHGEHHYIHVDRDQDHGYFQIYPAVGCPQGRRHDAASAAVASRAHHVAETGAELHGETASRSPGDIFYFFTDNLPGGLRNDFEAFRIEHREGMRIERGAEAYRRAAADFEWNLVAGTARVEPPAPFSGRAFYRREPSGPPSWTGSLRAPILGGKPMLLTGAAFAPHLGPVA